MKATRPQKTANEPFGKGNGDAKAEKKSESSNAGGKSSKKVDKNNAEADKKSISGYAHMLNRHDD